MKKPDVLICRLILAALGTMPFVALATGQAIHAQDKPPASSSPKPAPQKPALDTLQLAAPDAAQLATLAKALKENEQTYKDAIAQRDRANSLISQYEKINSDYMAVYFRSLAVAGKAPADCQPSDSRESIECKPVGKPSDKK